MIWFDRTQRTVLVGCRQCGTRRLFGTQPQADTWAHDHVMRSHRGPSPAEERAIAASQKRRQRHRDTP